MNQIIGVLWKREKDGKEYYSGWCCDLIPGVYNSVFNDGNVVKKTIFIKEWSNETIL